MASFRKLIFLFLTSIFAVLSFAQNLNPVQPLEVTTLSGSYLELRRNHFHGGLDFRTGGQVNLPIYAVEDGYVSYVSVESRSYGKRVMITHPDGTVSLYAHLNGFLGEIAKKVRQTQEEKQAYEVEVNLKPGEIKVKKGEQFAWSGNTGSSAGPHLHFELRSPQGHLLNPLKYNNVWKIEDNRAPRINAAKIYAIKGKGVVSGRESVKFNTKVVGNEKRLNGPSKVRAWGEIAFEVKAFDFMTGTPFHHTPRILRLYFDGKLATEVNISDVLFANTRAINSFMDYAQQVNTGEFFMKFTKEKNNPLNIQKSFINNGILNVNEEREYEVVYEVEDDMGLKDVLRMTIVGDKQPYTPYPNQADKLTAGIPNMFENDKLLMLFPEDALYTDLSVGYKYEPSTKYFSGIHTVGNAGIPLHSFCDLTIKIENDTLTDKSKYVIVELSNVGTILRAYNASYNNGYLTCKIRNLGRYAIWKDTEKPFIGVRQTKNIRTTNTIVLSMGDGLSGIKSYRGEIDGKWVLFEYDAKTSLLYCFLPNEGIQKEGKQRVLTFTVTDMCGNVATYTKNIIY
ncbi:MAG: M23 family metallopeptidase [Paludibacteraceae bacterium]|nr:M23 family metallopeptidase [Paludibacteraceae bacterium]